MSDFQRSEGFSLLELLVSIVVILIVVPMMTGLQIHSIKLNSRAAQIDAAVWAAQAKVEELRTLDFDDIDKGDDELTLADGTVMERSWSVRNNKPVNGTKTVTVTVTDPAIENAAPVVLSFVMSDDP